MSGTSFVQAVVVWLMLLALGGMFIILGIFSDATWLLVLMFGLVWVPLTMRWVWLMFRGAER